jgi:hypothetical protein
VANWVLTVMIGWAISKAATAASVALAREASPHQEKLSLTFPPSEEPEPDPHAASERAQTKVNAAAAVRRGREGRGVAVARKDMDVLLRVGRMGAVVAWRAEREQVAGVVVVEEWRGGGRQVSAAPSARRDR